MTRGSEGGEAKEGGENEIKTKQNKTNEVGLRVRKKKKAGEEKEAGGEKKARVTEIKKESAQGTMAQKVYTDKKKTAVETIKQGQS